MDDRTAQIEVRLGDVQGKVAAIDRGRIDAEQPAEALAQFDPVWDALLPRERANVLQLLIERVDYDGHGGELAINFRPAGLRPGPRARGGRCRGKVAQVEQPVGTCLAWSPRRSSLWYLWD